MTDSHEHKSPAEASKEGLRQLDEGHHKHGSTAHTPAAHESGAQNDETPGEMHRAGPLPYIKK